MTKSYTAGRSRSGFQGEGARRGAGRGRHPVRFEGHLGVFVGLWGTVGLMACATDPMGSTPRDVGPRDGGRAVDAARTQDASAVDDAAVGPDGGVDPGPYQVTVINGSGSGTYRAGDLVHVFAEAVATRSYLTAWEGDVALLSDAREWHTTFTMPPRDVTLTARLEPRSLELTGSTFRGITGLDKRVRLFVPSDPRALMFMLHGTGGSAGLIDRDEGRALALAAVERGYAVISYEAEEVAAGDLDGNQKIRWNAAVDTANVDFANINALIANLRADRTISVDLPLVVMGISNGGSMSFSLAAAADVPAVASAFPNLRFAGAVSYCASGRAIVAAETTTDTAWYLCRNDQNANVGAAGNRAAEANSSSLSARGIRTEVAYLEPSPLYDARFTRIDGIDRATSTALVGELRAAGYLDADGYLSTVPSEIFTGIMTGPGGFPTIVGLRPTVRARVATQIRVAYSDHTLFSDLAHRMLDFFDRGL